LQSELSAFQSKADTLRIEVDDTQSSLRQLEEEINAGLKSLELKDYEKESAEAMSRYQALVSSLQLQYVQESAEMRRLRNSVASLNVAAQGRLDLLRENESRLSALRIESEAYKNSCEILGLAADVPLSGVQNALTSIVEKIKGLRALAELVDSYVSSQKKLLLDKEIDATQSELAQAEDEEATLVDDRNSFTEAEKTASGWVTVLERKVDSIVSERLALYQPQIFNLFKRMVANPFLFQNVGMKYDSEGIGLSLTYQGLARESGEPLFFLSAAQANVLAISIFLSFASAQTWSKLDTLLLDDPVQHLDDLDALAFIDSLRTLTLGIGSRRKQIVVSTCDRNLYLLMIRKLGLLETDGLRLTGISLVDQGIDGPSIRYDLGGPEQKKYLQAV
jgi:hypothetical protein